MDDLRPVLVPQQQRVQILPAEDILYETVPVEHGAGGGVGPVAQDGAEDLKDGRDAAAAADHEEVLDGARDAVDGAAAVAQVGEFADRALEIDGVADGEGIDGPGHAAAGVGGGGGGEVELDEDVEVALASDFGDGRVGADDGVAVDGVPEAHHEVLADG